MSSGTSKSTRSHEPRGLPVSQAEWDAQYAAGRWSYLANSFEMGRYAVIAGYISRQFPDGCRLLDVGCGEGVLAHFLGDGLAHYTGLDLSEKALERVRVDPAKRTLIVADVEAYEFPQDSQFDAIVFNEVLYYPNRPMRVLNRVSDRICPGGLIVVSMWHSPDPSSDHARAVGAIWKAIDDGPWDGLDETAVTNIPTRRTWRIRAMTPRKA